MKNQQIDIIIFGGTGFTGKYVVEECIRCNCNWAIAGRSIDKMRALLKSLSLKTGIDVTDNAIIEADCENITSIRDMVVRGRVIINCCGPYRFYGECVVKACAENGVHYVDITGEPEFMEKMQLQYHDLAKVKRCYIVNSCGFDSVPADIGVIHFMKNFNVEMKVYRLSVEPKINVNVYLLGQVNYVESYMKVSNNSDKYGPIVTSTTWESAVHGFSNMRTLIEIRKKLFARSGRFKPEPTIPRRSTVHCSDIYDKKYSVTFPGSDRSVVTRTQIFLTNEYNLRPVQYNAYLICDSLTILFAVLLIGYFLQTLTKFTSGIHLLLKFPKLFTLGTMTDDGPSEEIQSKSIACMKMYGEGWSDEMLKNVTLPKMITEPTDSSMITSVEIENPSYGFTAMCAVMCANTILTESENMPFSGGVYTPGSAFYRTNVIENLAKRGVVFKILKRSLK